MRGRVGLSRIAAIVEQILLFGRSPRLLWNLYVYKVWDRGGHGDFLMVMLTSRISYWLISSSIYL
jgi:hypothetical protein